MRVTGSQEEEEKKTFCQSKSFFRFRTFYSILYDEFFWIFFLLTTKILKFWYTGHILLSLKWFMGLLFLLCDNTRILCILQMCSNLVLSSPAIFCISSMLGSCCTTCARRVTSPMAAARWAMGTSSSPSVSLSESQKYFKYCFPFEIKTHQLN